MIMEDIAVETFDSHEGITVRGLAASNYRYCLLRTGGKEDEPTEIAKAQSGAHTEDNAFFSRSLCRVRLTGSTTGSGAGGSSSELVQ
jgi:hypothetical protein